MAADVVGSTAGLGAQGPRPAGRLTPEQVAFLEHLQRRLFARRQTVEINGSFFRYMDRGEQFQGRDGDIYETLEAGLFVRADVYAGGPDGRFAGHTWLHMGHIDETELLLAPHVLPLTPREMEVIHVQLAASHALRSLARETREGTEERRERPRPC